MKETTVRRSDLLEKLQDNKETHIAEYEDAHLIWRDDEIEQLYNQRERAKLSETEDLQAMKEAYEEAVARSKKEYKERVESIDTLIKQLTTWTDDQLPSRFLLQHREPDSHENDYDAAITMLEMSVDETLTVPANLFRQLVMDEWDWKQDFEVTTSAYLLGEKGPRGCQGDPGLEGRDGRNGLRGLNLNFIGKEND